MTTLFKVFCTTCDEDWKVQTQYNREKGAYFPVEENGFHCPHKCNGEYEVLDMLED